MNWGKGPCRGAAGPVVLKESGAAVLGRETQRSAAPDLTRSSGQSIRFSALHVDEQRGGAAALRHQAVALLLDLTRLFAVLAADRERQRAQALLTDFLTALEAVAVGALFEAMQRFVDPVERFRLHLDEGEFDLVLDVQLGALRGVQDPLARVAGAFRAHVAHASLDFAYDLAAALLEDSLEFVVP